MTVVIKFALLFLIVLVTPSHGKDLIGDRNVKVFLHPENFFTAFETCRSQDMDLLMIHNSAEELQLMELTQKYNITKTWLAATDLGHEGLFISLSTGKRLEFQVNRATLEVANIASNL